MLSCPVTVCVTFHDTWGDGIISVDLDLRTWPYTLTEKYALSESKRRFLLRSSAEAAHTRAVAGAKMLVDLAQNIDMNHHSRLS